MSEVYIIKMVDNTDIFSVKCVNKTLAVGLISAVTICSCKEPEQHSQEIFHQDQIFSLQAASGYSGIVIGDDWRM